MVSINPNAVSLCGDKCNGCDRCMKRCPTEAIRVRGGKAVINPERCVGCGECVRVCPTNSKLEHYDSFELVKNYKYKVALPSPSLYGQFANLTDVNYVLNGLLKLGFDAVFEVGIGAEITLERTKKLINDPSTLKPIISTACPAVKNLILMRHDELVPHLSPILQPERITARLAIETLMQQKGLRREEIGICLITPCSANVIEHKNSDDIDVILATKEIYFSLLEAMHSLRQEDLQDLRLASYKGAACATNSGTSVMMDDDNYLTASGVENISAVLTAFEHEKLNTFDFVELYACTTGCTGGSMNIENCFLARSRLRQLLKHLPKNMRLKYNKNRKFLAAEHQPNNIFRLDEDMGKALKMAKQVNDILEKLPNLNCGYCGAPTCRAFAEDLVRGENVKCRYVEVGRHDD